MAFDLKAYIPDSRGNTRWEVSTIALPHGGYETCVFDESITFPSTRLESRVIGFTDTRDEAYALHHGAAAALRFVEGVQA